MAGGAGILLVVVSESRKKSSDVKGLCLFREKANKKVTGEAGKWKDAEWHNAACFFSFSFS